MAKPDSLLYIKRYLKTFEGVKETECPNSTYYKINDLKIRLSNHSKRQTKETNKYDISIVQPINNTKQYIVVIRGSLAMNIMNLSETKEFIRNYILIKQMGKFSTEDFDEETATVVDEKLTITDFSTELFKLDAYLKKYYKWCHKQLSINARKVLKNHIKSNIDNKENLDKCLLDLQNEIQKRPSRIFCKTEIEKLIKSFIKN